MSATATSPTCSGSAVPRHSPAEPFTACSLAHRPNPILSESDDTRDTPYSTPTRAAESWNAAPTIAWGPSTFSSVSETTADFSCACARLVDTSAYGAIVTRLIGANFRLATTSSPYVWNETSSGPYSVIALARAAADHGPVAYRLR